ncbi:hypothetical protein [Paracoccus sp. SM22M-07]|uniref:hypothetical protein n=1 Tax=Paracoccus sp. SM22M-07 TaxID=1520813 RepID=UPI000AB2860C|nr:hypothetical protein [Paracoccus sp. SM22M-07]
MIYLKRLKKGPACLIGAASAGTLEINAASIHYATGTTETYSFAVYRRPEVKTALEKMSNTKCAYCETMYGAGYDGAVEHYRPKARLSTDPHPGYWWLAASWSNLLPTCQHCNESRRQVVVHADMTMREAARLHRERRNLTTVGKALQFPVLGSRKFPKARSLASEDALLIDPTRRDPTNHIMFPSELGVSLAVPAARPRGPDVYGQATINIAALNRYELVRDRSLHLMTLRKIVLRLSRAIDRQEAADASTNKALLDAAREDQDDAIAELSDWAKPDKQYSAVAKSLLQRVEHWLAAEAATRVKLDIPSVDDL